jgi:hypothetical protein
MAAFSIFTSADKSDIQKTTSISSGSGINGGARSILDYISQHISLHSSLRLLSLCCLNSIGSQSCMALIPLASREIDSTMLIFNP